MTTPDDPAPSDEAAADAEIESAAKAEPSAEESPALASEASPEEADPLANEAIEPEPLPNGQGPDPVVGAGVTLLGIFVMALGGSRDLHYVFDVGVLVAVLGAGIFVLCVALSAMKMRKVEGEDSAPGGEAEPGAELPRVN